jgi:MYXO-CTERM domain-containing protein
MDPEDAGDAATWYDDGDGDGSDSAEDSGGCGCTAAASTAPSGAGFLLIFGVLWLKRRRGSQQPP